jgi:hypothetical protein
MAALALIPAFLSFLVLSAHFFRGGHLSGTALCLAACAIPAIRHPWAARIMQVLLLAGAIEWVRTLAEIAAGRRAMGMPWLRMALILGAVALAAALAALALEAAPARRWFSNPPRG